MMIKSKEILEKLDIMIPNAACELNFKEDYELLFSVILSAQSTDKRVNMITEELFKYNLEEISNLPVAKIEEIIKPVGTYKRKAHYISTDAKKLMNECNGIVPNDREYLENLLGVGRKTANVVLSNLYNVPAIAVDTHVSRVSKRLELANEDDDVEVIEQKLMKLFPKESWIKLHHQLVLFGRYTCKSRGPRCNECLFNDKCKHPKLK